MAAQNPAGGFTVLPQYQSNLYDIQRQQALSQALAGNALQNQASLIPQNMPVMPKYSFGAGLAQLGQAALAGYYGNKASEGLQNLGQQQWASLTGQGMPTAGQSAPQQEVPVSGAVGAPTLSDRLGTGQAQAQPSVAPLAPGGALNPQGLPSGLAAQAYLTDPKMYLEKFVQPWYAPTDATRMATQAGMNEQGRQEANRGALFHSNYVAPVAGGAGTVYRDPMTGQVTATNPNISEGMRPVYDEKGNFIGAMPIAGYNEAKAGQVGAVKGAEAQFETTQVFNPKTGAMEIVPKSSVLPVTGGGGQTRPGGYPGAGGVQAGPSLGQAAAAEAEGKSQQEAGMNLQKQADAVPQQRVFLGELRKTLEGFNSGDPNADWKLTAKKFANANSPFGAVFDPKSIASQEEFNKSAAQLAMSQFQSLGSGGANSTLETTLKANPNATLSKLGNKGIMDLLSGNQDAIERKAQAWNDYKAQNGPGSYGQFQNEWNKSFDPRLWMIPYQSKDEALNMINSMPKVEKDAFRQKFNNAIQNGWIKPNF